MEITFFRSTSSFFLRLLYAHKRLDPQNRFLNTLSIDEDNRRERTREWYVRHRWIIRRWWHSWVKEVGPATYPCPSSSAVMTLMVSPCAVCQWHTVISSALYGFATGGACEWR